jgi:hypothetical protein
MASLPGSAIKALPLTLFLMVCFLGMLGLLAIPWVGEQLGPLVCDSGETMVSESYRYSRPGESGTTVEYFCEGNGPRRPVDTLDFMKWGAIVYAVLFLAIIWPLITLFRFRKARRRAYLERNGISATAKVVKVEPTNVRINNKPVMRMELEVRGGALPMLRKTVKKALPQWQHMNAMPGATMDVLVDPADHERIEYLYETLEAPTMRVEVTGGDDAYDQLQSLKRMLEDGLITADEYEEKKDEILARM